MISASSVARVEWRSRRASFLLAGRKGVKVAHGKTAIGGLIVLVGQPAFKKSVEEHFYSPYKVAIDLTLRA